MHRQAGVMHVDAWLSAHACCWLACCHVTMTCLPAHERVLQAESLHACRAMLLTCVMLPWTGQLRTCCRRQASASCPSACCMQLVQPRPLRIRLPATPAHRWMCSLFCCSTSVYPHMVCFVCHCDRQLAIVRMHRSSFCNWQQHDDSSLCINTFLELSCLAADLTWVMPS